MEKGRQTFTWNLWCLPHWIRGAGCQSQNSSLPLSPHHQTHSLAWKVPFEGCPLKGAVDQYAEFFRAQQQIPARQLSEFLSAWLELCAPLPSWIESLLSRGLSLQFKDGVPPPFKGVVETVIQDPGQRTALQAEITSLLARGAISPVPKEDAQAGHYSRYFLVDKPNGGTRPILDLRVLNSFITKRSFRMLTSRKLLEQLFLGDVMTSLDLKDAYQHISIKPSHRKYLRFCFMGQVYQYNVMPFGYSQAPRVFTLVLQTALEPLRRTGARIYAYIDDVLVVEVSEEAARKVTMTVVNHLGALGFSLNWAKSTPMPAQATEYLGIRLNTVAMTATLSEARRLALIEKIRHFLSTPRMRAHTVQVLLGTLASAAFLVPLGMLFARALQRWFARLKLHPTRDRNRLLSPPVKLHQDMLYWLQALEQSRGVPMGPPPARYVTVFTDACPEGWGGVCRAQSVWGAWPPDQVIHINVLELRTVYLVLNHFADMVRGQHVLVRSDNQATCCYINRQAGIRSLPLLVQARELLLWAHENLLSLRARHIPGVDNKGADLLSRGGPLPDEWRLNPALARELWARFGRAEIDLFASSQNTQCPLWYSGTLKGEQSLGLDAFTHSPWPRGLLYAFPPVYLIPALLERIRLERREVILVAPDLVCARWYPLMVSLARRAPWDIPDRLDALTQAEGQGRICSRPYLQGKPLRAWLLRGKG